MTNFTDILEFRLQNINISTMLAGPVVKGYCLAVKMFTPFTLRPEL